MSDVDARWTQLAVPTAALHGFEMQPGCGVWLSVDSEGQRCVLLRNDTNTPNGTRLFESKGVSASIEDLEVTGNPPCPWVVVVCRDERYWEPFLAFAESIRRETLNMNESNVELTLRILRTWRWLWGTDPERLTRESALGLIGELWFLVRWAGVVAGLNAWKGPEGALHDFTGSDLAVEIKTAQSTTLKDPIHRITSIQQLTPLTTGKLYLFSLVISPDDTAGNTLSRLVSLGMNALKNDPARQDLFLQRLSQVGWAGSLSKQFDFPFRVVSEQLYGVDSTFPALSSKSFSEQLPSAVKSISYNLDLSLCTQWRVAISAEEGRRFVEGLSN